jgi:pimeloyl-ACP methyl ester carboxylesterase
MPRFASYDGTEIAYRAVGDGPPLVCLPGGPGRAAEYLGDLGGMGRSRRLVLPDSRGVGSSADPADPATFRVDRLVEDVDSLRAHLGLEQMDLLAHSAGAILATLYAAAHPARVSRLMLITPGLSAVGVEGTDEELTAVIERRAAQPWYPAARSAFGKISAGDRTIPAFLASRPLFYGRWDEAAEAHAGLGIAERHAAARTGFFDGVELDVPAIKASLAKVTAPVLLCAGDQDPLVTPAMVGAAAPFLNDATVIVVPGTGHFPWIDDPAAFTTAIEAFLS